MSCLGSFLLYPIMGKDVVAIDPHEGRGRRELPKRVERLYVP